MVGSMFDDSLFSFKGCWNGIFVNICSSSSTAVRLDVSERAAFSETTTGIIFLRNYLSHDGGIVPVNFGHILNFEAFEGQTLMLDFPKKFKKADFKN